MKNLMYFLLCNVIIVALVILTSCNRHEDGEPVKPEPFTKEQAWDSLMKAATGTAVTGKLTGVAVAGKLTGTAVAGKPTGTAAIKFTSSSSKDTSSARARMSEQAQRELIIWSTAGGL